MQDRIPQILEMASGPDLSEASVSRARNPEDAILRGLRNFGKLTYDEAALRACSFTYATGKQTKAIERAFVTDILLGMEEVGLVKLERAEGVFVYEPTPTAAIPSPASVEYPIITSVEYALKRTTRP